MQLNPSFGLLLAAEQTQSQTDTLSLGVAQTLGVQLNASMAKATLVF